MGARVLVSILAVLMLFVTGAKADEQRHHRAASPDKKQGRVEKEKKEAKVKDEDVASELEMLKMMEMLEHIDMLDDMDVLDGGDSK